jgi:hypothetical protein
VAWVALIVDCDHAAFATPELQALTVCQHWQLLFLLLVLNRGATWQAARATCAPPTRGNRQPAPPRAQVCSCRAIVDWDILRADALRVVWRHCVCV